WSPWPNREVCMLDAMGAFPRALFSEAELRAIRWFAVKNGHSQIPTVSQVKQVRPTILQTAGLNTTTYTGRQGNVHAVNDWRQIIAHELANPMVRRHMRFLAEDSGVKLEEARQAQRWLSEVDGNLAGPMARTKHGKDFFVYEPALANIDCLGTTAPVMPTRWFTREGRIFARVHRLRLTKEGDSYVIDGRTSECCDIPLEAFVLSVIELNEPELQRRYRLPAPSNIKGIPCVLRDDLRLSLEPWTEPVINKWRRLANGRRVCSVPLWFYCDDTSGNASKKWNKHDSILFTLAGLPRKHAQLMYNIHFVATSNIASPLELMEPVVEQLRCVRETGIDAWDCEHEEMVLAIPWVLAFQGDNPMASEFASHIGMQGRCFCRVCHAAKLGGDSMMTQPNADLPAASTIAASHTDSEPVASREAMLQEQLAAFMRAGDPRSKEETRAELHKQLARVLGGAPSAVEGMATATGCKDKYSQHWFEQLKMACSEIKDELRTRPTKEGMTANEEIKAHLSALRATMPKNLFNPVLDIPDFDANQDSPVEILHVVLLGVVKYWWRDAVSRISSGDKENLKARISGLDVTGLGIPQPRGSTLVQYAKSLTGQDFRVILQIAPSVLQGLIPDTHYEAWLTLCRLAPLVYQPRIVNLDEYMDRLEDAISDFLAATALWTTQWFNKPKFHLLVHLPEHIRRFGPAILYATEAFESYNFVIRLRSINSNRHTPSIDIARAFNHLHAVRHLVSGGY
ncbi:hypothetical protein BV25DRAFT_1766987, partial [Artomyces pyxidatus]